MSIPRGRLAKAMLQWPRAAKRSVMVLADLLVVSVALWAAFALKFDSVSAASRPEYLSYFAVAAASTLILASIGLYRTVVRFIDSQTFASIASGVLGSAVVLWLFAKAIMPSPLPFSIVVIFATLALVLLTSTRLAARWLLTPADDDCVRVVIYGAGDAGAQLSIAIKANRQFSLLAYVDENRALQGATINQVPVIAPGALPGFAQRHEIDRILLAIPSASRRRRAEILGRLEALNLHVQSVPDLLDVISGRARVDELREIDAADLLGRDPVPPHGPLLDACIRGKSVMVSGAGGSIGSELCRQIVLLAPKRIVLLELSEISLYAIERELHAVREMHALEIEIVALLGNAHDRKRVCDILRVFGVQTIYHAAAYKHVPIVEQNLLEGIRNNVFSTWHSAEAALDAGVETFVLISTDKAVNPANVMGATKRLAEIVLQSLQPRSSKTLFCMVRFGNVLGSSGSVVPLFQEQIRHGGPVTVTHRDVRRYFMTIPEAAQLVLQAGSMGTGGDVFVLDMGQPVLIDELARRMIKLMGLTLRDKVNPEGDIEIHYTGLRPGEKLYEELLIGSNVTGTGHPMIMRAIEDCPGWDEVSQLLADLNDAVGRADCAQLLDLLQRGVKEYVKAPEIHDLVWRQQPQAPAAAEPTGPKIAVLAEHRAMKQPPGTS